MPLDRYGGQVSFATPHFFCFLTLAPRSLLPSTVVPVASDSASASASASALSSRYRGTYRGTYRTTPISQSISHSESNVCFFSVANALLNFYHMIKIIKH